MLALLTIQYLHYLQILTNANLKGFMLIDINFDISVKVHIQKKYFKAWRLGAGMDKKEALETDPIMPKDGKDEKEVFNNNYNYVCYWYPQCNCIACKLPALHVSLQLYLSILQITN